MGFHSIDRRFVDFGGLVSGNPVFEPEPQPSAGCGLTQRASIRTVRLVQALLSVPFAAVAFAQGICIPPPIRSDAVAGIVYFGSETRPLSDVRVEIKGYSYGAPTVANTTTGKDGNFKIDNIKPGRYWLDAKHPVVGHFSVEFRLQRSWFRRRQKRIVIVIDTDPSKGPCWGGYAKTVAPD